MRLKYLIVYPHVIYFYHNIRLTLYPKRQRRSRLSVPEFEDLKRQCTEILKQGLLRALKSHYASLIVMVQKSDHSKRVCLDYRELNKLGVNDSFPLPRIDDLLHNIYAMLNV
jgi:putative transposase